MSVARKSADRAQQAFAAHTALLLAEKGDRALRNNPFWTILKQDAYERFALELQAEGNTRDGR